MTLLLFLKSAVLAIYLQYLHFLSADIPEILTLIKFFLFLDLPRYLLPDFFILSFMLARKRQGKRVQKADDPASSFPLISILVPAYNEEKTIVKTVRSLLETDYPNKEIIVINDGSTDSTFDKVLPFAERGEVKLIGKRTRGGKASCLNAGLYISRGEFIVSTDSDTTYDRDCMRNILKPFSNRAVGVVSGNLRVRNWEENLLTKLQACEYITTISVGRIWNSMLNFLMVASGALGVFRRDALLRVGGWDPGIGDDSNVTIKVRKIFPKVAFAPDAVCMTEVPANWRTFYKQRKRWEKNFYRNRLRKHRNLFNMRQFGITNTLAMLSESFFRIFLLIIFYLFWVFEAVYQPESIPFLLFALFIIYGAANFTSLTIGMILNERRRDQWKLIFYAPLLIFYRLFLRYVRTKAYLEEFFRYKYEEPFYPEHVWKEIPRW